jgi:hypothetical protein
MPGLDWLALTAWAVACEASGANQMQQAAVLMGASGEFWAAHPQPSAAVLSRQKVGRSGGSSCRSLLQAGSTCALLELASQDSIVHGCISSAPLTRNQNAPAVTEKAVPASHPFAPSQHLPSVGSCNQWAVLRPFTADCLPICCHRGVGCV